MKGLIRILMIISIFTLSSSSIFAEESKKDVQEESVSVGVFPVRIEQVTDDFYINLDYYDKYPSYERLVDRQNHLNGWSKFCSIYGLVCAAVGGLDLGLGIGEGDGYIITLGALCATEGIAVAAVGGNLRKKRDKTREEITRINTIGFPTSEISSGSVTFVPIVNLLSDNSTHDCAIGLGFKIEF